MERKLGERHETETVGWSEWEGGVGGGGEGRGEEGERENK